MSIDRLEELEKLKKQTKKITSKIKEPARRAPKKRNAPVPCLICKGIFPKDACVTVKNKGKIEGYFCSQCMVKVKQGTFPPIIVRPLPINDPNIQPVPWHPDPIRPEPWNPEITPWKEPWDDPKITWIAKTDPTAMRTVVETNTGVKYTIDDKDLVEMKSMDAEEYRKRFMLGQWPVEKEDKK